MRWIRDVNDILFRYETGETSHSFWADMEKVRLGPEPKLIEMVPEDALDYWHAMHCIEIILLKLRTRELEDGITEFHSCLQELLEETARKLKERHLKWLQRMK